MDDGMKALWLSEMDNEWDMPLFEKAFPKKMMTNWHSYSRRNRLDGKSWRHRREGDVYGDRIGKGKW